jgi:cysteine sulfinate desulfinase/cysteine desulfurase-like protein
MSLYKNIARKKARIAAGSKERMRKPGAKGAPSASAFKKAAKSAKKRK